MSNPKTLAQKAGGETVEYLAFTLEGEEYGIDILAVKEIRGYEGVTKIAHAPEFVKGVINLRGEIVPIVDMRIKLGVGEAAYTPFTVVIILNVNQRKVGIVVDSVSDVFPLSPEDISAAPDMITAVESNCVCGLGTVGDKMLILLDIERLIGSPGMHLTDQSES